MSFYIDIHSCLDSCINDESECLLCKWWEWISIIKWELHIEEMIVQIDGNWGLCKNTLLLYDRSIGWDWRGRWVACMGNSRSFQSKCSKPMMPPGSLLSWIPRLNRVLKHLVHLWCPRSPVSLAYWRQWCHIINTFFSVKYNSLDLVYNLLIFVF